MFRGQGGPVVERSHRRKGLQQETLCASVRARRPRQQRKDAQSREAPGFANALGSGFMVLGLLARLRTRSVSRKFLLVILLLLLTPGSAVAQDADADGVPDGIDNCVYSANPLQEDFAGLYGPPGDGIGDACQCGDVNSDGAIDLLDAATYERGLAGLLPIDLDQDKCSVIGNRLDCDPNDRQTLRETIVGSGAGIQP